MHRPIRRGPWFVAAALVLLLVLAVAAVMSARRWLAPERTDMASTPADALALALDKALHRAGGDRAGIALRPLAAASAPPALSSLADATCASIADRLARLPTLRVVPCRSTAAAVAAELDDRRLARLLAVGHVLTGRLERVADDRLDLTFDLREASSGRSLWHLNESIEVAALQGLPTRVAAAAAQALALAAPAPTEPAIDAALYTKYMRARELSRRPSLDDRRAAIALLDEVLAAEPDHVGSMFLRQNLRGQLLGNLGEGTSGAKLEELNAARARNVAEGLTLARRIVAADPRDLRGHWLLLGHEMETRQWVDGFARLDDMMRRAGRDAGLMRLAARLHLHAGYVERARELALAAARLNALDAEAIEILALVAGIQRRDEAMRELLAIAQRLGHQGMGRVEVFDAFRRGDWSTLERAHTSWVSWGGQWEAGWVAGYARGLADPSQRPAAIAVLDGHEAATRQHFVSYFIEYALLGDTARSMASVRHHAALPPATWMQHLWWPELAEVRHSGDFVQALRGLGMVQLWEARGAPDLCQRAAGGWTCR